MTTYWPAVDAPATIQPVPTASSTRAMTGTETILVVEDEAGLRVLVERILKRAGYTVLSAEDGFAALAIEAQHADAIDLLLSDMIMPGMNGAALAQQFAGRRPQIEVLFMSGYASREVVDLGMTGHHAGFLEKPFTPDVLTRKVREHLDRRAALRLNAPAPP